MLDGRVKTLHPKIHAGILHDRQNKKHKSEMSKQNFPPLDLIVVNFYPFQKIVSDTKNPKEIIENIDIGGPTMVRAAAKNFKNVTIITNIDDYLELIEYELKAHWCVGWWAPSLYLTAIQCAALLLRIHRFHHRLR